MTTIGEIKDLLEDMFDPVPVISVRRDPVKVSIKEAVRKYNAFQGTLRVDEFNFSSTSDLDGTNQAIDLEGPDGEDVKDVIHVLPDVNYLRDQFSQYNTENLPPISVPGQLFPQGGFMDPEKTLTTWVQQSDLFAQLRSFVGDSPSWRFEKPKLYIDDFPSQASAVTVWMRVKIPVVDSNDDLNTSYDIVDDQAFEWIYDYSKAALREKQGFVLSLNQRDVGGDDMKSTGRDRKKELEEEIKSTRDPLT